MDDINRRSPDTLLHFNMDDYDSESSNNDDKLEDYLYDIDIIYSNKFNEKTINNDFNLFLA